MTEEYIEALDQELEDRLKMLSEMEDLSTEEAAKTIKNLETLSNIRTDIYQKQNEAYVAELKAQTDEEKVQVDKDRLVADRKSAKATNVLNGVMIGVSAIGSIGIPCWIMTAERRGQYWSNRALNSTEKPPKLGFFRNPFNRK